MKKRKKKLRTLKSLHDEAWKLQSEYIRRSASNFQGLCPCYTCYRLFRWQALDAGHYKHGSYDFDPRHIKPQCTYCNRYCHGKPDDFYVHLCHDYGKEVAEELRTRKHWNAYNRAELVYLIDMYKKKLSTSPLS